MKSAIKYIIPSLLVILYITASIGIGVHKCDKDGTSTVVLLLKDASCEDVHQHSHINTCNGATTCSPEHHDHNCCHTEIHHIEQGYDVTNLTIVSTIQYSNLISDIESCQSLFNSYINYFDSSEFLYGGPPLLHQKNSHSYLAQWRL